MSCLMQTNTLPSAMLNCTFPATENGLASQNGSVPLVAAPESALQQPHMITLYQMPDGSLVMGGTSGSSLLAATSGTAVNSGESNVPVPVSGNQMVLQFTTYPTATQPTMIPQPLMADNGKLMVLDPTLTRGPVVPIRAASPFVHPAPAQQTPRPRALAPKSIRPGTPNVPASSAAVFTVTSAQQLLRQHQLLSQSQGHEEILQVKVQLQSQCFVLFLSRPQKATLERLLGSLSVKEQRILLDTFVAEQSQVYVSGGSLVPVSLAPPVNSAPTPAPSSTLPPAVHAVLANAAHPKEKISGACSKRRLEKVMYCDQVRYLTAGRHMPTLLQPRDPLDAGHHGDWVAVQDPKAVQDTVARLLSFHVVEDPDAEETSSFQLACGRLERYCAHVQDRAQQLIQYTAHVLERESWRCQMGVFDVETRIPLLAGLVDCEKAAETPLLQAPSGQCSSKQSTFPGNTDANS